MKKLTPMRAIRTKCLECCAGQAQEVRFCSITKCALHPYRMGHRPKDDTEAVEHEPRANQERTLRRSDVKKC